MDKKLQSSLQISTGGMELLPQVSAVSIAFQVNSVLEVETIDYGLGGFRLCEKRLKFPYLKDYDALDEGRVIGWGNHFDMRKWGFVIAQLDSDPVGAAVVAFDTPGVHMLEERRDLAVLWDIRIQPEYRGQGIGRTLFDASVSWALARNCRQLKIETQNVNIPACRFYAHMGCELGAIHRFAYAGQPEVAHEAMLLWYLNLS